MAFKPSIRNDKATLSETWPPTAQVSLITSLFSDQTCSTAGPILPLTLESQSMIVHTGYPSIMDTDPPRNLRWRYCSTLKNNESGHVVNQIVRLYKLTVKEIPRQSKLHLI